MVLVDLEKQEINFLIKNMQSIGNRPFIYEIDAGKPEALLWGRLNSKLITASKIPVQGNGKPQSTERPTAFQLRRGGAVQFLVITVSEKGTAEVWPASDKRELREMKKRFGDHIRTITEVLDENDNPRILAVIFR